MSPSRRPELHQQILQSQYALQQKQLAQTKPTPGPPGLPQLNPKVDDDPCFDIFDMDQMVTLAYQQKQGQHYIQNPNTRMYKKYCINYEFGNTLENPVGFNEIRNLAPPVNHPVGLMESDREKSQLQQYKATQGYNDNLNNKPFGNHEPPRYQISPLHQQRLIGHPLECPGLASDNYNSHALSQYCEFEPNNLHSGQIIPVTRRQSMPTDFPIHLTNEQQINNNEVRRASQPLIPQAKFMFYSPPGQYTYADRLPNLADCYSYSDLNHGSHQFQSSHQSLPSHSSHPPQYPLPSHSSDPPEHQYSHPPQHSDHSLRPHQTTPQPIEYYPPKPNYQSNYREPNERDGIYQELGAYQNYEPVEGGYGG